ncbi:helix-turn-helix domain-containing protein [Streptomyces sp. LHD-70]|uniref:helix-turn-helix domain-containing protein n=1 Tax=Streptomyces sp. LHD-70 TaxID=3072140 RepID=UPI0028105E98|nr:helix-turn-helix domain-containing protein [Streptomyces sp. LHD-70]MDQ8706133.1 helix-turn-helix domain-containing protein [Streptomyces sp. LHD-70]
MTIRPHTTRQLLLDVAERLYAERGVNGVSLREIGAAAGQRNTGAVRYHFGSKPQLLEAVIARRMAPANEARASFLAEAEAEAGEGAALTTRTLVEALVLPLGAQLGEPGRPSWYLRFLAQAFSDREVGRLISELRYGQGRTALWTEVQERVLARLDWLPPERRHERWMFLASFVTHALADRESLIATAPSGPLTPHDDFVAHVVDVGLAIITRP